MNLGLLFSTILLAADSTSNSATTTTTTTTTSRKMDNEGTCRDGQEEEGIFVLEQKHRTALLSSENDELFDSVWSEKIRETYHRLGYVLIRGLFDETELKDMSHAEQQFLSSQQQEQEQKTNTHFSSLEFGPIFHSSQTNNNEDEDVFDIFRHVSMESTIAPLIAKILFRLDDDDETNNLRILNDVVLAKDGTEDSFCGWHVDDAVFWPCSAHQPNKPSGVNAWIAMNDIPSKTYGGGMAISPSTHHTKEWIQQAYHAIGSTMTFPKEGIDGFQTISNIRKTCTLSENAPELYDKLEANKKEFDFQKGDVLLMDRWLWHRSVQSKNSGENKMCLRYTIRYEVGTTTFLNGFTAHPVALHDETLKGKTLNDICTLTQLPFFPKVWPRQNNDAAEEEEEKQQQMKRLQSLLPAFTEKKMAIYKELFENAPNNQK